MGNAQVLDCGGKSDATPLFSRTLTPFPASLALRKRRRRCPPSAVLLRRTGALPAQSKTSRESRRLIEHPRPRQGVVLSLQLPAVSLLSSHANFVRHPTLRRAAPG